MIEVLGTVGLVCLTALLAQWQSHRFRVSMRITTGEIADFKRASDAEREVLAEAIKKFQADLDNEKAKLTQLANRTR